MNAAACPLCAGDSWPSGIPTATADWQIPFDAAGMTMKNGADGLLRLVPGDSDAVPDQIARELEEDIVFGNLRPGQKLPEEDLSERFSASRHQVREALALLTRVGMVVKERNKGVRVRIFTAEEVHQ